MPDPKRDELTVLRKTALLVAVITEEESRDRGHALDELKGLVATAGVIVRGELTQQRRHYHPAYCVGTGKLEELTALVQQTDAELIIFDNPLTPAQGRNLEQATGAVIVDRSELILDIFASAARTYEAKLQVELAQLLYYRPRLKRLWSHLERIEGGVGAGRGPGEKQLETDRRLLDRRVSELRRKLKEVEQRRARSVQGRSEQLTIGLVGYTNSGKSTLTNALTGADVFVADRLFATLDTRTRRWELPHFGDVLLSDTVGFVRNLPHHLVASFRSTLEEARGADLLLHVVDASNPDAEQQVKTVNQVLEEIGVNSKNMLLVLNKVDRAFEQSRTTLDILQHEDPEAVPVSAITGIGLDTLATAVTERLGGYVEAEIETSAGNGRFFSFLARHGEILEQHYVENRVQFHCRLPRAFAGRLVSDSSELLPDSTLHWLDTPTELVNSNGNGR